MIDETLSPPRVRPSAWLRNPDRNALLRPSGGETLDRRLGRGSSCECDACARRRCWRTTRSVVDPPEPLYIRILAKLRDQKEVK